MQLPSNLQNLDQTKGWQKGLAAILLVATLGGIAVLGVNYVAPTLLTFFNNIIQLWVRAVVVAVLAVITGAVVLYIKENPFMIWQAYKKLSWGVTKWMIKHDRLSVMDAYADYIDMKRKRLDLRKTNLRAKMNVLGDQIKQLQEDLKANLRHGSAALDEGAKGQAGLDGIKVNADQSSIAAFQPMYEQIKNNVEYLGEVSENWGLTIESIRYVNARKRTEYETLKTMAEAVNEAREFLKGDTDASRAYNESVRQMEEVCANYTANIDQFEIDAKPVLENMRIEKTANMNDGLAALEAYRTNNKLIMPDFKEFLTTGSGAQTIAKADTNGSTGSKYFN